MRCSFSSAAARMSCTFSSVVKSPVVSSNGSMLLVGGCCSSSSIALSDGGVAGESINRSSSDRYELALDSADVLLSQRDGLLGHEGKAQAELMPMALENEDLRGVMSKRLSLGVGGGAGGGGSEDGEGEEHVLLLLKLRLNRMMMAVVSVSTDSLESGVWSLVWRKVARCGLGR